MFCQARSCHSNGHLRKEVDREEVLAELKEIHGSICTGLKVEKTRALVFREAVLGPFINAVLVITLPSTSSRVVGAQVVAMIRWR